jgi:hypothetical protein
MIKMGHAIAQDVNRWLPTGRPGFELGSGHMGFVVDKVVLGQVFKILKSLLTESNLLSYFQKPLQTHIYYRTFNSVVF